MHYNDLGILSFILKILLGTLRLGIAENTVMDSLAIAFSGEKENRKDFQKLYRFYFSFWNY